MKLTNEKEKEFFDKLIPANHVIDDSVAESPTAFRHQLTLNMHLRSAGAHELMIEINDNLLLLLEKSARVAYLNRISNRIIGSGRYLDKQILLRDDGTKDYTHSFYKPGTTKLISYSVHKDLILNHAKQGKYFLAWISHYIKEQETTEISNVDVGRRRTYRPLIAFAFSLENPRNMSHLKEVHNTLKGIKAIDCGLAAFKRVFGGKGSSEKVSWYAGPYLLKMFIHLLNTRKIVKKETDHWLVTLNCFDGQSKRGGPFKKETLSKAKGSGSMEEKNAIRRIERVINNLL